MAHSADELDPDWHRYPDTVLRLRTDQLVRVDLREPMGSETVAALESVGLSGPFAVLTAHDPRGRDEDADVNKRRAERLDARLLALGADFLHVDACSPDGSHREASVAALIEREQATSLAREFEQVAFFWFDGEKFWIIGALAAGDPVMLPRPV